MRTRIISGVVLLAIVAAVAWWRGPLLVGALLLAAGLSAGEFYGMARGAGHRPWRAGGITLAVLLPLPAAVVALGAWVEALPGGANPAQFWLILVGARPAWLDGAPAVLAAGGLLAALVSHGARAAETVDGARAAWTDAGLTLAGAVYTGGILQFGLRLNRPPGEGWWLLLVVLGTAAADSGAYFVGRAFGRRKLIPHISPNKTWAGFWGGLAFCIAAVAAFAGPLAIPLAHVLPLGAAISLSSVAGDLSESLLKRSFGAKDSSRLIPGHGGLLDRLDSVFFVLLVVYAYLRFFYR